MSSVDQVLEAVEQATIELAKIPDGDAYCLDQTSKDAWPAVYAATLSAELSDLVTLALSHLDLARHAGMWQHANVLESCARTVPAWSKNRATQIVEAFSRYMDAYHCRKDIPF